MSPAHNSARDEHASQAAARRKKSGVYWTLLIVVALGVGGFVVLLIAFGSLVFFASAGEAPTAEERGLLVDARALSAQIDDYVPDPDRETAVKRRQANGAFNLEYTYGRAEKGDDFYLKSTVVVASSVAAAKAACRNLWDGADWTPTPLGGGKLDLVERNDLFQWGQKSRLAIVRAAGCPAGNLFVAREGRIVVALQVTGACFEDGEGFSCLVGPALRRIEQYEKAQ